MKVARAITEGMRADRARDFHHLLRTLGIRDRERLQAFLWWGWHISGRGGLGRPGY